MQALSVLKYFLEAGFPCCPDLVMQKQQYANTINLHCEDIVFSFSQCQNLCLGVNFMMSVVCDRIRFHFSREPLDWFGYNAQRVDKISVCSPSLLPPPQCFSSYCPDFLFCWKLFLQFPVQVWRTSTLQQWQVQFAVKGRELKHMGKQMSQRFTHVMPGYGLRVSVI